MVRFLSVVVVLTFVGISTPTKAQIEIRRGETIICDVKNEKGPHVKILNPKNNTHNLNKRTNDDEPIFDVKYTGFTEEARAAFQYAIDIWENNLHSDIKIKVFANWAFVENINTLAFVTPTEVKNFENTPIENLWYPIALAEKLSRRNINSAAEADIVATFNNRRTDWYFGLDGNCPSDKFDLVTVVLHELGHGLGFSGTFRVSNSTGFVGLNDGLPKIYDTYLRNGTNQPLLSFPNNSFELANQITSNSVVFNSLVARTIASSSNPRVYAPSPYEPGSSISHLDEGTYNDTPNSLMTPFVSPGKVSHNPGPLTRGMFYEMGWLHTFLDHEKLPDTENMDNTFFQVQIQSDTVLASNSALLHVSYDGFNSQTTVQLVEGMNGVYETQLINPTAESTISYYFTVSDVLNREYKYPIEETEFLSFYFGIDNESPAITHTSIEDIIEFEESIPIEAHVSDNIGIERVYVQFQINENAPVELDLVNSGTGLYSVNIDLTAFEINQGDQIKYQIYAIDNSSQNNQSVYPANQQAVINVRVFEQKDIFVTNLNSDQNEFFGDFSIKTITGFTNGAIHSTHPYPKSASAGQFVDFTYTLLYPIKVQAAVDRSFIEFNEVVLVEPGIGDDHTNPQFGDYVIVEGSSDSGETWIPLVPGYDSRANQSWLTYFNSNVQNGDSKAIGTLNYFKPRLINLLDNFNPDETIFIRFRLHSDNQKNGWGWAIDDLKIQNIIVGIEEGLAVVEDMSAYPNPTPGRFFINKSESNEIQEIKVFNEIQQLVRAFKPFVTGENHDISDLPPGVYLLKIETKAGQRFLKILKR